MPFPSCGRHILYFHTLGFRSRFGSDISMRYLIPVFFALLLSGTMTADAQWRAQLHIGLAGSSFRGDIESDKSPIYRLSGGGGLQFQSPTGFVFEPGVLYVQKGAQLDGELDGIPIEATSEITYVEIPLLVGYRWRKIGSIRPKLLIGPTTSFRLESSISFQALGGSLEQEEDDESVQERDTSLMVVLAGETTVGGETLVGGIRSSTGLTNIRSTNPELYNTSIGLYFGIIF